MCEVFPNYELVVFQPHTLTTMHLGSGNYHRTLIQSFRPNFFLYFSGSLFSSFLLPPPHPQPLVIESLSIRLSHNFSPDAKRRPNLIWPPPDPFTCHPLPLFPAPRVAYLCLPPFPVLVRSSLCRPWPALSSLSSHGGLYCHGSLRISVSLTRPT